MIDTGDFWAVVLRTYGGPDALGVERLRAPVLRAGEVRIRVLAAAVNHSDLEIRRGAWPVQRVPAFPYVPGLEAVGEVVEVAAGGSGPAWAVGDRVWTMMQGLGGVRAERDGGYAEQAVVAGDALAPLPPMLDPLDAAAVGLAGVTAAEGLRRLMPADPAHEEIGPLPALAGLAGRRVAVTGAGGGVGSLAVGLAAAAGAEVTAIASGTAQAGYLRALGAAHVVDGRAAPLDLTPGCMDGVLDTVAGPLFAPLVASLAASGRYCLVGAVGGSAVSFDAWALEARTLTAWSSENLDGPGLRAATTELVAALGAGMAIPARTVVPLADAAKAHELLEGHQVSGRIVLVP